MEPFGKGSREITGENRKERFRCLVLKDSVDHEAKRNQERGDRGEMNEKFFDFHEASRSK